VFGWLGISLLLAYVCVGAWMFDLNPLAWHSVREVVTPSPRGHARIARVGVARWWSLLVLRLSASVSQGRYAADCLRVVAPLAGAESVKVPRQAPRTGHDSGMLNFGLAIFLVSVFTLMGLFTWARWHFASTRRVRYVSPRYLLASGVGAIVGLLFIAAVSPRLTG
jgi:hypothetical protein